MDIAHSIRTVEIFFPLIHNNTVLNLVTYVKDKNRTEFHDRLCQLYEAHSDRMGALLLDCKIRLAELENEHLAKLKISIKQMDFDLKAIRNKPTSERLTTFVEAQKALRGTIETANHLAEQEHIDLKQYLRAESLKIIDSYREIAREIAKEYR